MSSIPVPQLGVDCEGLASRQRLAYAARLFFQLASWICILVLAVLLIEILRQGIGWLDFQFLTSFPSRFAERAGIKAALWGTVWLIALVALISIPVGVGAAIHLEEYARPGRLS